jgi:hypothetical protein
MTQKKLQVFVSSTYLDLQAERQAAVEAILKAGHIPAGMELFAAGDQSQLDTIRRWIDESDVFMLIMGGRYGSIDPKISLSYIELEYDYAVSRVMPVFAVVITDTAIDRKVREGGLAIVEREHQQELQLFRAKVLSRISSFFSDPKDVKLAVHETLSDIANRYTLSGWVPGSELAALVPLIEEVSRSRSRQQELEEELKALQERLSLATRKAEVGWTQAELAEIAQTMRPIRIEIKREAALERVPILHLLSQVRDRLISGVANRVNASDFDMLLFYNLCPKLALYELAYSEKVYGVAWRRFALTAKGRAFLVYLDKNEKVASGRSRSSPESKSARKSTATAKTSAATKNAGKTE